MKEECLAFGPYDILYGKDNEPINLGRGMTGTTYHARHRALQRETAVKVLTGSDASISDARVLAGLTHENIVFIYDVDSCEDGFWIAMELAEGPTLRHFLDETWKKGGTLPYRKCLDIIKQMASGIDAAWKQVSLAHRDLKPENVILVENLRKVKLIDFGSLVLGTPDYSCIEQLESSTQTSNADPGWDVYALGSILWEMLTETPPFQNEARDRPTDEVIKLKREESPPFEKLKGCPRELVTLLKRMLSKDSSKRIPDAETLLELIQAVSLKIEDADEPAIAPSLAEPVDIRLNQLRLGRSMCTNQIATYYPVSDPSGRQWTQITASLSDADDRAAAIEYGDRIKNVVQKGLVRTVFVESDDRDKCVTVITEPWTPELTLAHIQKNLPEGFLGQEEFLRKGIAIFEELANSIDEATKWGYNALDFAAGRVLVETENGQDYRVRIIPWNFVSLKVTSGNASEDSQSGGETLTDTLSHEPPLSGFFRLIYEMVSGADAKKFGIDGFSNTESVNSNANAIIRKVWEDQPEWTEDKGCLHWFGLFKQALLSNTAPASVTTASARTAPSGIELPPPRTVPTPPPPQEAAWAEGATSRPFNEPVPQTTPVEPTYQAPPSAPSAPSAQSEPVAPPAATVTPPPQPVETPVVVRTEEKGKSGSRMPLLYLFLAVAAFLFYKPEVLDPLIPYISPWVQEPLDNARIQKDSKFWSQSIDSYSEAFTVRTTRQEAESEFADLIDTLNAKPSLIDGGAFEDVEDSLERAKAEIQQTGQPNTLESKIDVLKSKLQRRRTDVDEAINTSKNHRSSSKFAEAASALTATLRSHPEFASELRSEGDALGKDVSGAISSLSFEQLGTVRESLSQFDQVLEGQGEASLRSVADAINDIDRNATNRIQSESDRIKSLADASDWDGASGVVDTLLQTAPSDPQVKASCSYLTDRMTTHLTSYEAYNPKRNASACFSQPVVRTLGNLATQHDNIIAMWLLGRVGGNSAGEWLTRASEAGHPEASWQLGVLRSKSGNLLEARNLYLTSSRQGSTKGTKLYGESLLSNPGRDVDSALAAAASVLNSNPVDADALYLKGMCYEEKGASNQAADSYRLAVKYGHDHACGALARLLLMDLQRKGVEATDRVYEDARVLTVRGGQLASGPTAYDAAKIYTNLSEGATATGQEKINFWVGVAALFGHQESQSTTGIRTSSGAIDSAKLAYMRGRVIEVGTKFATQWTPSSERGGFHYLIGEILFDRSAAPGDVDEQEAQRNIVLAAQGGFTPAEMWCKENSVPF